MTIAIIDYGIGNLRSVEKAFTTQGIDAVVTDDPQILNRADKLVLPGVGAFAACMNGLRRHGFDQLVIEAAAAGTPILGLCVGLQMMFEEGHEFGVHRGLGLMPGRVIRFPEGLHVPHIGWNQVHLRRPDHPVLSHLTTLSSTLSTRTTSNQPTRPASLVKPSMASGTPRSAARDRSSESSSIRRRARQPA